MNTLTQNLEKLAAYLERTSLLAKFDMTVYCEDPGIYATTCGSIGCIIGHATLVLKPKRKHEEWYNYSRRIFPDLTDLEWRWLFSPHWNNVDNTPQGAATRIRYFLAHGAPKNTEDQIEGRAPLSYTLPLTSHEVS